MLIQVARDQFVMLYISSWHQCRRVPICRFCKSILYYFEEALLLTKKKPPLGNIKGQKCGNGQRTRCNRKMSNFTGVWQMGVNGLQIGRCGVKGNGALKRKKQKKEEWSILTPYPKMRFFALKMRQRKVTYNMHSLARFAFLSDVFQSLRLQLLITEASQGTYALGGA